VSLLGAISLVVVHVGWSVAKVPWRLYCEQQQTLAGIGNSLSEVRKSIAVPQEMTDLLKATIAEREHLRQKLADLESRQAADQEATERMKHIQAMLYKHADQADRNGGPNTLPDTAARGWGRGTHAMLRDTSRHQA
jgi:hypothetical protein